MATPLRHFADCDDLFDTATSEEILAWVNELAKVKAGQREMGLRYRSKQKVLAQAARQLLDPDELARVEQLVEERMSRNGTG